MNINIIPQYISKSYMKRIYKKRKSIDDEQINVNNNNNQIDYSLNNTLIYNYISRPDIVESNISYIAEESINNNGNPETI